MKAKWRPIRTAPKNIEPDQIGPTVLLLALSDLHWEMMLGYWREGIGEIDARLYSGPGWYSLDDHKAIVGGDAITHWAPTPEIPKTFSADEEKEARA